MKKQVMALACMAFLCAIASLQAQEVRESEVAPEQNIPKDDIVQRKVLQEKQPLAYAPLREADLLWENDIVRVLDVREKMNLPFVCPKAPLFNTLAEAVSNGEAAAYSAETDDFSIGLSQQEVNGMMASFDTIIVIDPVTLVETVQVVENKMNWEDVKRFRIKEKWFFDARTSTMQCRILGIAPLREEYDNMGNFRYETPMFWVNFQEIRPILAQSKVYDLGENLSAKMTWEDLFEMRYFSSYVIKGNNVYDRRIEDYASGRDALLESNRIEDELFNREQDMWSR